jgi:D-hydroxyproline dehydrogenase subunit beta
MSSPTAVPGGSAARVEKTVDVAIVGAGILGLAHAYLAARSGKSVVVFERNPRAMGASVRNFGMVWPIGQPSGQMHQIALRSRELWLEMLAEAQLPSRPEGSLHVAYQTDEAAVMQEFAERAPALGYDCTWLDRNAALARSAAIEPGGLLGALWSNTEFTVDPPQILATLPAFLAEKYDVRFHFQTPVRSIAPPAVETAYGSWRADVILVCSGDDFETLYPETFAASQVTRCKLQMLRTPPQPHGWQLGPSLAAGLTLRFYPAFAVCRSLDALQQRIAAEMPEYNRWGIHALVSQNAAGAITLGDSHEYGLAVDVFDKDEIDRLILLYISRFLRVPDLSIARRWHGVYAKHPEKSFLTSEPEPGVCIVTATGGSGMTLSFGLAEHTLAKLGLNPKERAHA